MSATGTATTAGGGGGAAATAGGGGGSAGSAAIFRDGETIVRDGTVAGVDATELTSRFGSPCFVYDFDAIARRAADLRRAMPPVVDVAYAVKANPSLAVLALLGSQGLGADVASGGELAAALRAGIAPDRIVVTGPGKSPSEHRAAVQAGVRAVTVESPGELDRLERVAVAAGRTVPVLLRASTADEGAERLRIIGDGGAGKFGMGADDLRAAARTAARSLHLELLGLHRFGASNVLDADRLLDHVRGTVDLAAEITGDVRVPLRLVDVGGGLGVPYRDGEAALDVDCLGEGLRRLSEMWGSRAATRDLRVLLEPGRFLVGAAGAYLATVLDCKRIGDGFVVILDGGINHVLRPALIGHEHRVVVVSPRDRQHADVSIAGPLCTGLDVFASRVRLPLPEPGDLVAVLDVGAYGFTESMPWFLSRPSAAEVGIRGGHAQLLRPRLEPSDVLDGQLVPEW